MQDFKKIVAGAFYYVFENRTALTNALALPFIALVITDVINLLSTTAMASVIAAILAMLIHVIFAIVTHRVVLMGADSVSRWGVTRWTQRETLFLVHALGLAVMAIPILLLVFIPIVGPLLALVVICWLYGRFSLVFPGIAIDQGVSFNQSWQMTESYQLLMVLVVIVFPLVLTLPIILLSLIPYTFLLTSLLSTLLIVFQVAALSMAYLLITDRLSVMDSEA